MTLVCGTDLTPAASIVVDYAAQLARIANATLMLVHVAPSRSETEGTATDALERERVRCEAQGVSCEALHLEGEPWLRLMQTADERRAPLIVVGRHGAGGAREIKGGKVSEYLLGTTVDRLVRYGGHPVIVVPPDGDGPWKLEGQRWLIGVDFGEPALQALRVATRWIERTHGVPVLVHVIPPPGSADLAESDLEFERRADKRLRKLAHVEGGGAEHRLWSAYGRVADALGEAAEDLDAAILVLGSHGRHGMPRFFLGSTAELCLRRARRPVLVVGPPA